MRLLLIFFGTLLFAQAPVNPPGMQCQHRTLVLFSSGPNAARDKELAPAHFAYMRKLMQENKIIAAGPFATNDGAAVVFASSDWKEVQNLLNVEPFTKGGVIQVSDHKTWIACQSAPALVRPAAR